MNDTDVFLGIDVGSVSVKTVLLDAEGRVLREAYGRAQGRPLPVLVEQLEALRWEYPAVTAAVVTGTGKRLVRQILGIDTQNEIVAHMAAATHAHPAARTVIEIGGQDSKLIFLDRGSDGEPVMIDHAMNEVCAAALLALSGPATPTIVPRPNICGVFDIFFSSV